MKNDLITEPLLKRLRTLCREGQTLCLPAWPGSAQALTALALRPALGQTVLLITDGARSLEAMHRNLLAFAGRAGDELLYYPAWEVLLAQEREPDADITGDRLFALAALQDAGGNRVVVTSVQALMQAAPAPHDLADSTLAVSLGAEVKLDALTERLAGMGYAFNPEVQNKGEASLRGGLLDVWPPSQPWPCRLEFFGNMPDSIRTFDPIEQRSLDRMNAVTITPAGEWDLIRRSRKARGNLLDYLPARAVLVWSDYAQAADRAAVYEESIAEVNALEMALPFSALKSRIRESADLTEVRFSIETDPRQMPSELDFEPVQGVPALARDALQPDVMEKARAEFLADLGRRAEEGQRVVLFFDTPGGRDGFERMRTTTGLQAGRVETRLGEIAEGFVSASMGLAVVGEQDLHGYPKRAAGRYAGVTKGGAARTAPGARIGEWPEITPGDLVVHVQHGIGKYLGLYEIELQGQRQEVLTIEYAEKAKLHVPVWHAHLLSRYVGVGRYRYSLHKLGGKRWQRERVSAELSVRDLASSLLEVQATREALEGLAFSSEHPWQREFEAAFPYRETEDQQRALQEVREDMESARPMDRLICGDVGYGKTEVAMRAAFRAVLNGKQVAVLVPTTVLAQQHFDTFSQRMAAYPVELAMLSRFCARAEHQATVRGMADGTVDLVIGTHGLLQPGIRFKDLGLVIIDEEQRFGVEHKERLKQMRELVDVLTLTATPIPRTLYMSLTGAKDISTIQTPPQERLPVETVVAANTDKVVREAILLELNRAGQVYYLHNRVMTIERVRERLEELVPEASIEVAHGQMPSVRLAAAMRCFAGGKCDLLLCTNIVESGLDIPNANTIFIDRADRFGMADLYQLRGRVGRSRHKGYAYLLLPPHGRIDQIARKRIGAIRKYSHFGASFKLALRDLEIRGAGNLLGAQQSGHIAAVGFGLYCQLLKRTVARLKGEKVPPVIDVDLKLDFVDLAPGAAESSAAIPALYVEDERMRVRAYRRIAEAALPEDVEALREEFRDRFGVVPGALARLLKMALIRIHAAAAGVHGVEVKGDKLMLSLGKDEFHLLRGRFPRLKRTEADEKLDEIIGILQGLVEGRER